MALALLGLVPQGAALAYIDRAPTLVRTLRDATHVVVVEVERVDDPAQVITFKVVEELKGTGSPRQIKHLIKAGAGGGGSAGDFGLGRWRGSGGVFLQREKRLRVPGAELVRMRCHRRNDLAVDARGV